MIYDKIKEQFITEVEAILKNKREGIALLVGLENATAKLNHLDNLQQFTKLLNIKINRIIDENIVFETQDEGDQFSAFIKPTFDKFFKEYTEIAEP